MKLQNRHQAGLLLASILKKHSIPEDFFIFGLTRGGVVVAYAISEILDKKMYPLVVKKIARTSDPEFALGSLGPQNSVWWDKKTLRYLNISKKEQEELKNEVDKEVKSRQQLFGKNIPNVKDKTVIVVDDGVATGATAAAAAIFLRKRGAGKIILATPVISSSACQILSKYYSKIISVISSKNLSSVGEFYNEFPQIEDAEVLVLLDKKYT